MIKAIEFPNKEFSTKQDLFAELKKEKKNLISLKKSVIKNADAVNFGFSTIIGENNHYTAIKEDINSQNGIPDSLDVKVVINTTNFLDSHGDVHINGIWNKSLKDNKSFLHLQEHEREFDKVISDNAKGYVKTMTWQELGLPYQGTTEALIFESKIQKKRNEFMLNQYANGWVKNHSVGMRYVSLDIAINSEAEWDKAEKEIWDKYYPLVANKDLADEKGYFWVVLEAKIIEGSAVVMGSNSATPTLENKEEIENEDEANEDEEQKGLEPPIGTLNNEPTSVTQGEKSIINLNFY